MNIDRPHRREGEIGTQNSGTNRINCFAAFSNTAFTGVARTISLMSTESHGSTWEQMAIAEKFRLICRDNRINSNPVLVNDCLG